MNLCPAETNAIWDALHPRNPLDPIRRRHPRRFKQVMRDLQWLDIMQRGYRSVLGDDVNVDVWIEKKNPKQFRRAIASLVWLDRQLIRHGEGGLL